MMKLALIIAVLMAGCQGAPTCPDSEKIWTFGFGRDYRPFEFLDEETGEMHGLGVDFMREACHIAHKKCEFIGYKDYSMCWDGATDFAVGLSARYFDGCVNWLKTGVRDMTYAHSVRFADEVPSYLYARAGTNIRFNSLTSQHDFKIVLHANFAQDAGCLRRNGVHVRDEQNIMEAENFEEMSQMLSSGQVDLAFMTHADAAAQGDFVIVGDQLPCSMGGLGVMAMKNNGELLAWLNPALKQLVASDEYSRMCYIAGKAYGGEPWCFSKNDEL